MKTRARHPAENTRQAPLPPLLKTLLEVNRLKNLYRQGWLRHLPPEKCETVAEHTYATALTAWLIAAQTFPELDQDKVLKLALLHDLAEIYAGDITPTDGVSAEEKERREAAAMARICSPLPDAHQWRVLWDEYRNGSSAEAQFVKQIDRLEMALQAQVYQLQEGADLSEFFRSAEQDIRWPELRALLREIIQWPG